MRHNRTCREKIYLNPSSLKVESLLCFSLNGNPLLLPGLDPKDLGEIDGKDMWNSISEETESARKDLVYNIDEIYNYVAVRQGDWKYVVGTTTGQNLWYGNSGKSDAYNYNVDEILHSETATALAGLLTYKQIEEKNSSENKGTDFKLLTSEDILRTRRNATIRCPQINVTESNKCKPSEAPCIFNLKEDPCERINLAQDNPAILTALQAMVERYRKTALKPRNVPRDPNADPALHNNTWTNWKDWDDVHRQKITERSISPLAIGLISAACFTLVLVIVVLVGVKARSTYKTGSRPMSLCEDPSDATTVEMGAKVQTFEDRELQMRCSLKDSEKSVE